MTNIPNFPTYAFINGVPYGMDMAQKLHITSPIDKQHLTDLPALGADDVDYAVQCAKNAFEQGVWKNLSKNQKQAILLRFADLIDIHRGDLAHLESSDMGMPYGMCQGKNIASCADTIRWYAHAIDKIYDETINDNGKLSLITREPVGVVAVITPWNFPAMIVGWKIAPALIMGNSIVLKPAESASLATLRLAELATEAGIPNGVFNVITGQGCITGKALAKHPDVRVLAFTGSGTVGGQLLKYAGASNLKRVYLELGGKNANIVLSDAPDLNKAVQNSVMALFANSGQICASPSRLLVERRIYSEFIEKCVAQTKKIIVGNPFDDSTHMGPLANENQYNTVLSYIAKGKVEGANCVLGGDTPEGLDGYYINPTIFTDVTPDMTVAKEEIFGPVLAIMPFDTLDEAIDIANDTAYGLTAGIWTQNISTAHYASARLQAGTVFVNHFGGAEITVPFGGVKQSGNGVDKSLHAIGKYADIKTTVIML